MLMITTRIAKSSADLNVGVFVSQLLLEALENDAGERRSEIRYPFFTPVSIQLPDRLDKPLSAFSRNLVQRHWSHSQLCDEAGARHTCGYETQGWNEEDSYRYSLVSRRRRRLVLQRW